MSPLLTTVIQDGGHVTRRSVVFLFLDFDSSVKRFSYNRGRNNMVFLYSTHFCLYTVPWYIVCGLNHSESQCKLALVL